MSPRRTGTLRLLGTVLGVIGVSLLVVGAWRRLWQSRNDADPALVALVAAVVVGVVVVVSWCSAHRSRARQLTIATRRPGWQLHGVWTDESLSRELVKQGVWEPGLRRGGGSRLTLAWSTWGIELWRGGRAPYVVASLPWSAVASTTEGSGHAAALERPAAVVTTLIGASLVLVPCARADGGVLPASTAQVQRLITALRTTRDGS